MILGVYLVMTLLVVTKLLDVLSTAQKIGYPLDETNPIARRMMRHAGTGRTIWLFFFLALAIISTAGWTAIAGGIIIQASFMALGLIISIVQGAVAHCNWTGQSNLITRRVNTLHLSLHKIIRK